jgi:hypothetical protein
MMGKILMHNVNLQMQSSRRSSSFTLPDGWEIEEKPRNNCPGHIDKVPVLLKIFGGFSSPPSLGFRKGICSFVLVHNTCILQPRGEYCTDERVWSHMYVHSALCIYSADVIFKTTKLVNSICIRVCEL